MEAAAVVVVVVVVVAGDVFVAVPVMLGCGGEDPTITSTSMMPHTPPQERLQPLHTLPLTVSGLSVMSSAKVWMKEGL